MKRIIRDHLRRWGWLWLVIGIANGLMLHGFFDEKHDPRGITVQLVLWLGAMQLTLDLNKGISRVLTTLPLTARKIGRAWWYISVAMPVLWLATTSGLAAVIYATYATKTFPLNLYAINLANNTLFLGAMFSLFLGEVPGWPATLAGWLRRIFSTGMLLALIFSPPTFDNALGIILSLAALVMTVIGWFRAEQIVVQRATFRPGMQLGRHQPGKNQAPAGFGGLLYLWQTMAMKMVYLAVAGVAWFVIMHYVLPGTGKMSVKQFLSATTPAFCSFGFFALFMFWLMPLLLQLRHLRTLPISTSAVAAMLTLVPCVPVCLAGLAWSELSGSGFQIPTSFLTYAAAFCLGAPLVVWQGMRQGIYIVVLILVMMVGVGGTIFFKGTPTASVIIELVSLAAIGASFEITRRLLKSSSQAYRINTLMPNGWSQWR